jgi:perosamine synthetase
MIPLTKPLIDDSDCKAVQIPLETGWLVQGPQVARFEEMVAHHCHVRHAVATTSCTTALHLSLLAAGIGPNNTVLVPSFTYVATANAVEHAGAEPTFIDVERETMNMSISDLEKYLEGCESTGKPLPKAVIPVHLFGLCSDMHAVVKLAERYSFMIIEDAACSLGSSVGGVPAGTFGLAGCFSFHPRKLITTGEGGMIVAKDDETARRLRILRDHGAETSDLSRHGSHQGELPNFEVVGYNYRMTDIQGALGCSQMAKLPHIVSERIRAAKEYHQLLVNLSWLRLPSCPDGYVHTYQSFVCRIDIEGMDAHGARRIRNALMAHLARAGVASRPGTHAVHLLGYYQRRYGLRPEDFPNSTMAHCNTIALPIYAGITHGEQVRVAEAISSFKL